MTKAYRLLLLALFVLAPAHQVAARTVDIALILAVDVSGSIDADRYNLQLRGYAAAFADPRLAEVIRSGAEGAIAVTLVQWSASANHRQIIGWTVIDGLDAAQRFASAVSETQRQFFGATSIGGAINFCRTLFDSAGVEPRRRVIDISGDGANNDGMPAAEARDAATAAGITINGLPIVAVERSLDAYYRDNVIGGPGAFLIVAKDFDSFAQAILSKLIREIAGEPSDLQRFAAR
jgi:hypothetical protein